jgi:hypothetical protein
VIFQREQFLLIVLLSTKLFLSKTSINVISNFNNIGDVPFSNRDYFRLTGGSRNTMDETVQILIFLVTILEFLPRDDKAKV